MRENYRLTYSVDIVLCIDTTGSMHHVIDIVKDKALSLYQDIADEMALKHKTIQKLRIRVIAFKDYHADGEDAMLASDFFEMPEQAEELRDCVMQLEAEGGGDIPEDGLEALAFAMKSHWNTEGQKRRHIIVLWSDASTHPIGAHRAEAAYPANMAESFAELTAWWGNEQFPGCMDQDTKRLLLFAPEAPDWTQVRNWDNTIHVPTELDSGLEELDYKAVLAAIANSI